MNKNQKFSRVLLVSVPKESMGAVSDLLPGAYIETKKLSHIKAQKYNNIHILSVFVHDLVDKNTLLRFPQLKAVITRSGGYDHLPLNWMKKNNIAGYYLEDYSISGVSEFTLALLLALLRRIPEGGAVTKKLSWRRSHLINQTLRGTTVGVLGTGKIGETVVRLLLILGARVIGYDIIQNKALLKLRRFQYINDFQLFLSRSYVLTIHVPLNPHTHHMIDKQALYALPRGAYIVNTSRGGIINQTALEKFLRSGHIAGYGADVLPGEPCPPDLKRFKDLSNVIITPHIAASDKNTIEKRYKYTAKIIRAILSNNKKILTQFRIV